MNEYVADNGYILLSLIVTDIGNVPTCCGLFVGAIIRLGNDPVTNPEADPKFMLTKRAASDLSGSTNEGNLKV